MLDYWIRDMLVARENGHDNTNLLRQSTFDETVPSGDNYHTHLVLTAPGPNQDQERQHVVTLSCILARRG